jgi:hypothetical protein
MAVSSLVKGQIQDKGAYTDRAGYTHPTVRRQAPTTRHIRRA